MARIEEREWIFRAKNIFRPLVSNARGFPLLPMGACDLVPGDIQTTLHYWVNSLAPEHRGDS